MKENKTVSKKPTVKNKKTSSKYKDVIKSRVRKDIQNLSPYSVPHFECSVKLDGNESPFPLPYEVLKQVTKALNEIHINRYPDPEVKTLRDKISKITGFSAEGIVIGNGSDELIEMIMRSFSGGTGKILYPVPTFSMYKITAITLGLKTVPVELDNNFDIDLDATLDEIAQGNPNVIFLASPNNPTGNTFSDDKIVEIIESSSGIVVVDEAYSDFSGKTFLPMIEKHKNLIILRTMSKVGFAGIRTGILLGREDIVREINKVRLPYNINSYSQRAAEVVLGNIEFIRENVQLIIRERERVYKELKLINGVLAFPTNANFVLFKVTDADKTFKELKEKDILIRNFNPSGGRLENCLRVTIGTPEENDAFLSALREILSH